MTPRAYIRKELNILIKSLTDARIRYAYDENAQTHFIEIVPNNIYHFNSVYISWESRMFDMFVTFYPTENICFISDDAVTGIEHVEYILYGETYIYTPVEQKMISRRLKSKSAQPGKRKLRRLSRIGD
jgi:hypothetical protein